MSDILIGVVVGAAAAAASSTNQFGGMGSIIVGTIYSNILSFIDMAVASAAIETSVGVCSAVAAAAAAAVAAVISIPRRVVDDR